MFKVVLLGGGVRGKGLNGLPPNYNVACRGLLECCGLRSQVNDIEISKVPLLGPFAMAWASAWG